MTLSGVWAFNAFVVIASVIPNALGQITRMAVAATFLLRRDVSMVIAKLTKVVFPQ